MDKLEKNIGLIGMSGSGKTTIGNRLARKFNLSFYDTDKYIEDKYNMRLSEIYKKGERYFRAIEKESIKKIIKSSPKIISTGGGIINSEESMKLLKKDRIIIFINRPLEEIIKDIDIDRLIFKGDRYRIYKLYEERYPLYMKYKDMEIENEGDINMVIDKMLDILENMNI